MKPVVGLTDGMFENKGGPHRQLWNHLHGGVWLWFFCWVPKHHLLPVARVLGGFRETRIPGNLAPQSVVREPAASTIPGSCLEMRSRLPQTH